MQKTENKTKTNMYFDSVSQWNVIIGCLYSCEYCLPSFQRQMKRQKPTIDKNGKKRGCQLCYDYIPHFHPERLHNRLPKTNGDEFIWCCSSSDITFAKPKWIKKIITKILEYPDRTFFFQTKNPICFKQYSFPDNVMLGITLETDRSYVSLSKAPEPYQRYKDFLKIECERKVVTIEPILEYDGFLPNWIKKIVPERVYIGYDTKNCGLPEPSLWRVKFLIEELSKFTKVKLKYMKNTV